MLLNATYYSSLMPRYQMQFTLKGKSSQYLYKVQTNMESYLEKQDSRLLQMILALAYVLYHLLVTWLQLQIVK